MAGTRAHFAIAAPSLPVAAQQSQRVRGADQVRERQASHFLGRGRGLHQVAPEHPVAQFVGEFEALNEPVAKLLIARHAQAAGDEQLRDGLIQRFEFTYALSHWMLSRYPMHPATSPEE